MPETKAAFLITVLGAYLIYPQALAQADSYRYQNVTYKLPAGWKVDKGHEHVPYAETDGRQVARMTIERPQYSGGKFLLLSADQFAPFLSDPAVIEMDGPREIFLANGVTGLLAWAVQSVNDTSGSYVCNLAATIDLGPNYQVVTVDSQDRVAFNKARAGAEELIGSMLFDKAQAEPRPPPAKITRQAIDKAPEDIPYPLPIPTSDLDKAAETAAKAVLAGGKDALPALVFAAVQSGFAIHDSKGSLLRSPASGKGIGVGLTAIELTLFNDLEGSGSSAELDGLCSGIDEYLGLFAKDWRVDFRSALLQGLREASSSPEHHLRFLARFTAALGKNARQPYDLLSGDVPKDARLDAVQVLFIVRKFVGDLAAMTIKNVPHQPKPKNSAFSPDPTSLFFATGPLHTGSAPLPSAGPEGAAPGEAEASQESGPSYLEEVETALRTVLLRELLETIEHKLEKNELEGLAKQTAGLNHAVELSNAINGILKFWATYACITAKFEVTGGKKPGILERTKNTKPGEIKNVHVRFKIDEEKLKQFCKDIRSNPAFLATDPDLPEAGPMRGLEVEWDMPETDRIDLSRNIAYLQGAADAEGKSNFLKSVTDSEGGTAVDLVGAPQKEDMSGNIIPVRKSALVRATIQIKRPSILKDLFEASIDAWTIFSITGLKVPTRGSMKTADPNVLAFITPILQILYRMKCLAPKTIRVPVLDWEYAGYMVSVDIRINGSGKVDKPAQKGVFRWSVDRTLKVEDIVLRGSDVFVSELLDASKTSNQDTYRTFYQTRPETAKIEIKDWIYEDGVAKDCDRKKEEHRFEKRQLWLAPPEKPQFSETAAINGIRFAVDTEAKRYTIALPGLGGGSTLTELSWKETYRISGREPVVTGPNQHIDHLFFGLKPVKGEAAGTLGTVIIRPLPPLTPEGKIPVIDEGAKIKAFRSPFGPVDVEFHWRIEHIQGKGTVGRAARWDPWKGASPTGPFTDTIDYGNGELLASMATCNSVEFELQSLPEAPAAQSDGTDLEKERSEESVDRP